MIFRQQDTKRKTISVTFSGIFNFSVAKTMKTKIIQNFLSKQKYFRQPNSNDYNTTKTQTL